MKRLTALLLALVIAGCATPPPEKELAQPVEADALDLARHVVPPISPTWWQALDDATLNRLIDTTLQQSPDLAAALARLQQAEAQSGFAASQLGVQTGFSTTGAAIHHNALNEYPILSHIVGDTIDYGTLQLKGQWRWDLWGEHKNELAAAIGKKQATAYEIAQTRLVLAQAVATQYLQLQTLDAQKALLDKRLAIKKKQVPLLHDRIKAGLMPPSQLYPLQSAEQQLQAAIRDLEHKGEQIRHGLALISGQSPTALAGLQPEPARALPAPPVQALTADLLGKRPDLAAQREGILARGHLVKAAEARFYPNIKISALAGWSVLQIGDFPNSRNMIGALLPSISLPIFTAGALEANLEHKQAEYNEQIARYNKNVYQALREAADALSAWQAAADAEKRQRDILAIARKQHKAVRERIRAGLETELALLNAEDEIVQTQSQLLQASLQQRLAWVALNVAFGGGFTSPEKNRHDKISHQ
ncbi:MAG: efflux transporter outer membrane subunit [Cardiobacteriaceae bacterium]|nr:efflux transporter outer membrane subunit [Cardiobacteriaceae bacterium]